MSQLPSEECFAPSSHGRHSQQIAQNSQNAFQKYNIDKEIRTLIVALCRRE